MAILPFSGSGVNRDDFFKVTGTIWSDHIDVFTEQLKGIVASDSTPLWSSIELAINEISKFSKGYKNIIFVTDGLNNVGDTTDQRIAEIIRLAKQNNVNIYGIAYGDGDGVNVEQIEKIAVGTGAGGENVGYFINVDAEEIGINVVYSEIVRNIVNAYRVSWKPTGASTGQKVDVHINLTYEYQNKIFETTDRDNYIAK